MVISDFNEVIFYFAGRMSKDSLNVDYQLPLLHMGYDNVHHKLHIPKDLESGRSRYNRYKQREEKIIEKENRCSAANILLELVDTSSM